MARLLADEQFPQRIVDVLRTKHGHDVKRVRDFCSDKRGDAFDDETVLQLAKQQRRAVLTKNVAHFLNLHQEGVSHEGIIACSFHDPRKAILWRCAGSQRRFITRLQTSEANFRACGCD